MSDRMYIRLVELPIGRRKVTKVTNKRAGIILGKGFGWLMGKEVLVKIIVLERE